MAALTPQQLAGYLQRVGHSQPSRPCNLHTLAALHTQHLRRIPFENLSLRFTTGHDSSTELQFIYSKLVDSPRGGYCFEQNGLFGAALRSLGFEVLDVAARVVKPTVDALEMGAHDHHMLLVHLDNRLWLADVGFGGSSIALPLLLHDQAESYVAPPRDCTAADAYRAEDRPALEGLPLQRMHGYRLRLGVPYALEEPKPAAASSQPFFASQAGFYLQRRSTSDARRWVDQYFFRLDQFLPDDYELMNRGLVDNPSSYFNNNLLIALQTEEGRLTIENDHFRQWRDGEAAPHTETRLEGEEQLKGVLREHFGIEI